MFSRLLYDQYDLPAKLAVSGYLTSRGNHITQGTQFGVDFSGHNADGRTFFVEVEVKCLRCWPSGSAFPFETITISERKNKFAESGTYFFVLNESRCDAVAVPASILVKSPLLTEDRGRGLESFFDITVADCMSLRLA